MVSRQGLSTVLKTISDNVYLQPPPNSQMTYPCIVYRLNDIDIVHAGNKPYKHKKRWELTVIDVNPDSELIEEVKMIPTCQFDRFFVNDGLNHFVFRVDF